MFKENTTYLVKRKTTHFSSKFFFNYHVLSVSTIRAAVDLKQTFDQMAAAEKAGSLTPEEKRRLEEAAAEKVLPDFQYGTTETKIFSGTSSSFQGTYHKRSSVIYVYNALFSFFSGRKTRDRIGPS